MMICNKCGRKIKEDNNGILQEDVCAVRKEWGYFSEKDLAVHSFALCEKCYDEMIEAFSVPVKVEEKSEVL